MRVLLVLAVLVLVALLLAPAAIERSVVGVVDHPAYAIRPEAAALHARLVVGDLHADSLMWNRDLLERGARGHVDFPRLQEGNVALQVFAVPTRVPALLSYERNSAEAPDLMTALVVLQRWPLATWSSLTERALHAARRLDAYAAGAPGSVRPIREADDLEALLAERAAGGRAVGALLAIEGAHALDGRLENVARLHEAGYRMVGLQHFFDNALGGSLHGESGGGLTDFGRRVLDVLQLSGMIVDVAHSSPTVVEEVLELAERPVVVSHTGVRRACDHVRNLPDPLMRRVAERGGLVGIGYWDAATCDISPAGVARAIAQAVDLLGAEHVALGSDYDGGTTVSFDTAELAVLTQALLDAGLAPRDVEAVMGGNLLRFLRRELR